MNISNSKIALLLCISPFIYGCSASSPVIYSSSNDYIIIQYHAYNISPTVTRKAKALADIHCRAKGRVAFYDSVSIPNIYTSSMERHKFNCVQN